MAPVDVYKNRRVAPMAASKVREHQHRVNEIARTFVNGAMTRLNQMSYQIRPGHFECSVASSEGNAPFSLDYSVTGPTSCLAERAKQDFRALIELHEQKMAGQLAETVSFEIGKLQPFRGKTLNK